MILSFCSSHQKRVVHVKMLRCASSSAKCLVEGFPPSFQNAWSRLIKLRKNALLNACAGRHFIASTSTFSVFSPAVRVRMCLFIMYM